MPTLAHLPTFDGFNAQRQLASRRAEESPTAGEFTDQRPGYAGVRRGVGSSGQPGGLCSSAVLVLDEALGASRAWASQCGGGGSGWPLRGARPCAGQLPATTGCAGGQRIAEDDDDERSAAAVGAGEDAGYVAAGGGWLLRRGGLKGYKKAEVESAREEQARPI